jgi:hypothetical protein
LPPPKEDLLEALRLRLRLRPSSLLTPSLDENPRET